MFGSMDHHVLTKLDGLSRRRFLSGAAKTFLGVGLLGSGRAAETATALRKNPAKKVIYLYMSGGMSHIDTFNPRPEAAPEVRGDLGTLKTNADGVVVSEYLPGLARHMDKMVVFNGVHSSQGAHEQGQYYMRTNHTKRGIIQHPHIGAWHLKMAGRINSNLPGFINIGGGSRSIGAGFFDSSLKPLSIRDANSGLSDSKHYADVSPALFDRRLDLSKKLNRGFRNRYDDRNIHAYTAMYDDAVKLMRSEDLDTFDLTRETAATRASYGGSAFAQGCLLARRLSERGVRFVEVRLDGWDTHTDNFERVGEKAATLDKAMAALLGDLQVRGLLDETLVVLATEFGRTPKINQNEGRDHYPKAFSTAIAGGGIHGGQVYGQTDKDGAEITDGALDIRDFNATIAYGLGLAYDQTVFSPTHRPFTLANKGRPITSLFPA